MTRPDSPSRPLAQLVVRRDVDLPAGVLWPALVDPELLAGWLGETTIADDLSFTVRAPSGAQARGSISALVEAELLELATDRGRVVLRLDEQAGGLRGSWTALSVEAAASVAPIESWDRALDRLENLLHGRPTDWLSSPSEARRAAH